MLHPMRHGRRLAEIRLFQQSLSTSGSQRQFFRHGGKRYSHIIDPKNGFPAEGVLSVTVLAPNATLSDALSTSFFVMGPERTEAFCREYPEIGAIFLLPARQAGGFECRPVGFPEEKIRWSEEW
jgi:thiamine biosynthesis lipoprotein